MLIAKLKEAEKKLRESEEALSSLINATDETLLLADTEGNILVANEVVARRLGKHVRELIGTSLYDSFPPDVAKKRKKQHDEIVRTGKPARFEDERAGRTFETFAYPVFSDKRDVSKIAIFAKDITERKGTEEEREKLISELQEALTRVKTLGGLLPICSSCKKIRDDKGYWNQIEVYIRDHSEADFSHGICPECSKIMYPDFHEIMYPDLHKKK
ncbi:MAG: hypothetical protein C0399_10885 [Syntrophus sp. (in: bacteria)]|nr:hypothetical protein [Syntrophus sp. (in: bacteria)]